MGSGMKKNQYCGMSRIANSFCYFSIKSIPHKGVLSDILYAGLICVSME